MAKDVSDLRKERAFLRVESLVRRLEEFDPSQPRDADGKWGDGGGVGHEHVATGNTYAAKGVLKDAGFKYNGATKEWTGDDAAKEEFDRISSSSYSRANSKATNGVTINKRDVVKDKEKVDLPKETKTAPPPEHQPLAQPGHGGKGEGGEARGGLIVGHDYGSIFGIPEGAGTMTYLGGDKWHAVKSSGEAHKADSVGTTDKAIEYVNRPSYGTGLR
jgi:hypothetical protein